MVKIKSYTLKQDSTRDYKRTIIMFILYENGFLIEVLKSIMKSRGFITFKIILNS